jgi:hypothetical protein
MSARPIVIRDSAVIVFRRSEGLWVQPLLKHYGQSEKGNVYNNKIFNEKGV